MLKINKIISCSVIDYAAEELKKYLRMMMPECGDVEIRLDAEAKDGFILGLMRDLGLDLSDVENAELDDVIYIETDTRGGTIAGSNPRSVLIAVYEYLRQNGCEWLLPGVDGEYIPLKEISPVSYRHKPKMRYRGNCIEGATSQEVLLGFIELMPKLGLNSFMIQFRNPIEFFNRHYKHIRNDEERPPEEITKDMSIQWTRMLECEMDKRGIMLHSCGHGWNNDPFGIDSSLGWRHVDDSLIPDEYRDCIAMVNGKRTFFRSPPNTQFCMSSPRARGLFVNYVADYVASHGNTSHLHIWLADDRNNHCECDECVKRTPSDWYVILLNELDAELTRRDLDMHIVFIVYIDTTWAPLTEKIVNKDRFTLMIAPIYRDYDVSLGEPDPTLKKVPYVRNKTPLIKSLQEFMLYFDDWRKMWQGDSFAFEYHFWKHHQFDLSGLQMAARLHQDARDYLSRGVNGIMQCGSQRGFTPNGFAFYTHARSLYDVSLSLEEITEKYYSIAYGEDWRLFYNGLKRLSDAVPYEYMCLDKALSRPYAYKKPSMTAAIESLRRITKDIRELIRSHYNSEYRVRTVLVRLLEYYLEYVDLLSVALAHKSVGDDGAARVAYEDIRLMLGRYESYYEKYDDHLQKTGFIRQIVETHSPKEINNSQGD